MYSMLILPLISGGIAQIIKLLLRGKNQKFDLTSFMSYSGMPSAHSAIVVSLATTAGLENGWNSPIFAISFIFAFIVIRDALGIRRYLGQHGRVLNVLVKDLKNDELIEEKYPHLLERIGHTISQVAVGGLIGLLISLAWFYLV